MSSPLQIAAELGGLVLVFGFVKWAWRRDAVEDGEMGISAECWKQGRAKVPDFWRDQELVKSLEKIKARADRLAHTYKRIER